ncbi:hypothetical protein [Streptomyces sp. NPDC007905]|uniref:hypothetical protein n=1 Tax=Streptomyces sp. NPDC007905 TaxID=3364788 RepID=UPI0036E86D94
MTVHHFGVDCSGCGPSGSARTSLPLGDALRLRARWADRRALPRFGYWLLSRGAVVLAVCAALYVRNGFLIGWSNAYDVLIGITSPAAVRPQ